MVHFAAQISYEEGIMSLLSTAFGVLNRIMPAEVGHAHCDIPCGIYDPIQAKIAAQTVQKMVMRIEALEKPDAGGSKDKWATYENALSRYIQVKEEHGWFTGAGRSLSTCSPRASPRSSRS